MKIFLSWSGERSKHVAIAMRDALGDIIQDLELWMSHDDIVSGARWSTAIGTQLDATDFGVLCLTPENVHADWLLFEAGALAKKLSESFVVPYLIDMEPSEVPPGPLSQFQARRANRDDTLRLVTEINAAFGSEGLDNARLQRLFDRAWPDLEKAINAAPKPTAKPKSRPPDEMLSEILDMVRSLARRLPAPARIHMPASEPEWPPEVQQDVAVKIGAALGSDPQLQERAIKLDYLRVNPTLKSATLHVILDGYPHVLRPLSFAPDEGVTLEQRFEGLVSAALLAAKQAPLAHPVD